MEARVLYEASVSVNPMLFLFLPMTAVGIFLTIRYIGTAREMGSFEDKRRAVIFGLVSGVSLLTSVFMMVHTIRMNDAVVGAYRRGEYRTVEGYVEQFHPEPRTGHDSEHFFIDGVWFQYSNYSLQAGYHNAASLGGVITGDGQHLKIGYTEYGNYGNVIVYIEELP